MAFWLTSSPSMTLVQIFVPHAFYCSGNIKVITAITTAFQKYVIQLYFHKMYFLYISIIAKRLMMQYPYQTTVIVMMNKIVL